MWINIVQNGACIYRTPPSWMLQEVHVTISESDKGVSLFTENYHHLTRF